MAAEREEAFDRLLREALDLPLKSRMRLLDALKRDAVLEREDGVRFSLESVSEFKRARKAPTAHTPLLEWVASFGPGDVLFDIGANTGSIALAAARRHEGRVRVVAIEPAFDNFASLVRNVLANHLADVITPLHLALYDETGVRPLHRAALGAGSALHAVGEPVDYARRPFTAAAVEPVLAFRLDDLVSICGLPLPTRIKLDVDGAERRVLAGAAGVLQASRCEIYVELVETVAGDPYPEEVTSFLGGLGYQLKELVEHRPPGAYPRIVDGLYARR